MYKVPHVSADLTPSETVLQIADALDVLGRITDSVFDRVERRVEANAERIAELDKRMQVAARKVEALKQSKKSTAVFSSAKYPARGYEPYETIFANDENYGELVPTPLKKIHVPEKCLKVDRGGVFREKMRFYHVPPKSRSRWDEEDVASRRRQPKTLTSATSLLVYNTADNPYVAGGGSDRANPLDGSKPKNRGKAIRETEGGPNSGLDAAPASLSSHAAQQQQDGIEGYFYSPDLGELPELDLPEILDLPNIAHDLSYASDLGPAIAPSAVLAAAAGRSHERDDDDLPDFRSVPESRVVDVAVPPAQQPPPPPPIVAAPPPVPMTTVVPPPPPPPPQAVVVMQRESLVSGPSTAPPPPPPTSLPPLPALPSDALSTTSAAPPPPPPAPTRMGNEVPDGVFQDAGRANLMEAIRSAGGKGLKSVKERKRKEKLAKQDASQNMSASGSGDLMSDLASKLQLRRKGIAGSGKSNAHSSAGKDAPDSVMDKISAMIPSPGKDESDDDLDDWDD